jgi:hypothetical protein
MWVETARLQEPMSQNEAASSIGYTQPDHTVDVPSRLLVESHLRHRRSAVRTYPKLCNHTTSVRRVDLRYFTQKCGRSVSSRKSAGDNGKRVDTSHTLAVGYQVRRESTGVRDARKSREVHQPQAYLW